MKNIKPLIIDTTYILPLFGIQIVDLSNYKKISRELWTNGLKGYKIYLPSICLLEVLFKLTGEYRKSDNITVLNRYTVTLPSILSFKPINIFNPLQNPEASRIAITIRHAGHKDLIDCLIAATAMVMKGFFLTEDNELCNVLKLIPEYKDISILSWKEFIKLV